MGTTWRLLRVAKGRSHGVLAFLLAALIAFCSSAQLPVRTPTGVQCPTASIQEIAVPIKSCCGHVIGYQTRKPKPGEKGFVQCRCAEKRSAQQQADVDHSGPRIEMLPPSLLTLDLPERLPEASVEPAPSSRLTAVTFAPPVPPPFTA